MVGPAFHPDDVDNSIGPPEAFDPGHEATPGVYALQHHLVLEVAAFLAEAGVTFEFRGGTALHTKIDERRRFSIDLDITTPGGKAVHEALKAFVKRFPNSNITVQEPPEDLQVDGVRHTLEFGHAGAERDVGSVRILVEVVEVSGLDHETEPLRLEGDGFDWGVDVRAPTFESFAGQKVAVLGPNTIGKPVGLNPKHTRTNQTVCKQIFDLREVLRLDLDPAAVAGAYEAAVAEANELRGSSHEVEDCLADARALLALLRRPRSDDKGQPQRYGLWSGYRDSRRWIANRVRDDWRPVDYRIAGGVLTRLTYGLVDGEFEMDTLQAPLTVDAVPADVRDALDRAQAAEAAWFSEEDFGADARLAWAWAPRELW